ncbi:carboxymuconolactone decarboxylase family protein [Nocardia bovistercoris]|uniref:Carboxymuconolactone decarboxylase family protein n=1 Tax=Nocardia bovistercoris TaxID=2785916 RepID=A0A931ID67_9NOCA|nr:carboxymuconolactone decarboxylase family protein [Nocardia bovistercoris]MBH0778230.1 carboxymuconolactone decarboxylase family protein [Nocardia bovistercoris]
MVSTSRPRIAPGRLRELGPLNWAAWQVLSRAAGTPDAHLFSTLGRTGGLFRGWLHYSGKLMPGGRLPRHESELVILRVAHLRDCAYETDHHIRLGKRAGITPEILDRIHTGPEAPGWSPKHRALLTAVDRVVETRDLDDATWNELAEHYDERALIEIVLLTNQYEGLAATITALRIQRDDR